MPIKDHMRPVDTQANIEKNFYDILVGKYGQLIPATKLVTELSYSSEAAFRQAIHRKTLGLPLFKIKGRRGRFAYSRDVAIWLSQLKN